MRTIPADKLNLEIKGFGALKLPLTEKNAKALIHLAKPAQFGWREKTLLDKSVRNAWEISRDRIKIDTTLWDEALTSTLDLLKTDLGLSEHAVLKSVLHNLLIYDKGQFFNAHQDSEKLDGMVASLIVVLPSAHRGGRLIVDHHREKKEFRSERFSQDKLSCIAFYADCHHEVKAVTVGYRVTLTYHLVLETNDKKSQKMPVSAKTQQEENLIRHLQAYFADQNSAKETKLEPKTPKQLVYLLDHSYTQKGLSWRHLKNGDRLRAQALKAAAHNVDLEITLALADVKETWDCEINDSGYRYQNYDDDEGYDEDVECHELIGSETVLKHWIDEAGNALDYDAYNVLSNYICWTKASDALKPFESEYEGFMGNYGNTMDRWYHRAAIVLWQKKDHYPVLFEISANSVIDELHKLSKKSVQASQVGTRMKSLLPYWSRKLPANPETALIKKIFELALYINDASLAKAMIAHFTIAVLSPETAPLFLLFDTCYGRIWSMGMLKAWTLSKNRWEGSVKITKIDPIVKVLVTQKDSDDLTDWLLTYQLKKIKEEAVFWQKNDSRVELIKSAAKRINTILDLLKACIRGDHADRHLATIDYMIEHPQRYSPLDLLTVIQNDSQKMNRCDMKKWGYTKLSRHVIDKLTAEQNQGLRKPDDWSITENVACSCKDCSVLKNFLYSRDATTLTWPLAKDRRAHMHQMIEGLGIPVLHQTKHIGSPHQLMLTKTNDLHQQAKQRFDKVEKALQRLQQQRCIVEKESWI